MKMYKKLIGRLENYAFVLPGINKIQAAQEGIQYAVKLAKIGTKAEKKEEDSKMYYKFSLSVLNLLIDECYISIAKIDAIIPDDYYRVMELEETKKTKAINMKAIRMILILRRLLRKRLS